MAERRAEHADVVASSVTHPNHGLRIHLISNPKPWRDVLVVGGRVALQIHAILPCYAHLAGCCINPPTKALARDRFRYVQVPPDSIVHGEFVGRAPGILRVEEAARLGFVRVRRGAHKPLKVSYIPEQEAG